MPAAMKLGLFSINTDACSLPDGVATVARVAEEVGFESLWAGEHIVLPDPQRPPVANGAGRPDARLADDAHVRRRATRRRSAWPLESVILPQRNPVVLAKELASLDVLSSGRLIVGIGAGYLEPEIDRDRRADARTRRSDGRVHRGDARPLDDGTTFATADDTSRLAASIASEADARASCPPIVVGGQSAAAHERAVRYGHGWYGFFMTAEQAAQQLEGLRRAAATTERSANLPPAR